MQPSPTALLATVALFPLAVACGSNVTVESSGSGGSSSAAVGSSSSTGNGNSSSSSGMCAGGCTAPGLCSEPDPCACPCTEGEQTVLDGQNVICSGGCYVPLEPFTNHCGDMTVVVAAEGGGGGLPLTSSCPSSWGDAFYQGATGYEVLGGANFIDQLVIEACGPAGQHISLTLGNGGPNPYPLLAGSYFNGQTMFQLMGGDASLQVEGPVGELISGSYNAFFTPNNIQVSGSFDVCHVPDIALP